VYVKSPEYEGEKDEENVDEDDAEVDAITWNDIMKHSRML
jgi:hypothetical protein